MNLNEYYDNLTKQQNSTNVIIVYYNATSTTMLNVVDYGVLENSNVFYCCNEDGSKTFFPMNNVRFFGRLCDYERACHVYQTR